MLTSFLMIILTSISQLRSDKRDESKCNALSAEEAKGSRQVNDVLAYLLPSNNQSMIRTEVATPWA